MRLYAFSMRLYAFRSVQLGENYVQLNFENNFYAVPLLNTSFAMIWDYAQANMQKIALCRINPL